MVIEASGHLPNNHRTARFTPEDFGNAVNKEEREGEREREREREEKEELPSGVSANELMTVPGGGSGKRRDIRNLIALPC